MYKRQVKRPQTEYDLHSLLTARWSPRSFTGRAISETTMHRLFEAASWAPSASNHQPWRYLYAHKGSEAFEQLVACLTGGNQLWANEAAVLLVCMANTKTPEGKPNGTFQHDLGMANLSLVLQARHENIYSHMMAGYDAGKVQDTFGVKEPYTPVCMMALGYLGEPEELEEPFRTRELTPRTRHHHRTFAFKNEWTPER